MLGLAPRSAGLIANPGAIVSPWAEGSLSTVVWSDVIGADVEKPLTRTEAMQSPGFRKARDLLCGTAMRFPLIALQGDTPLSDADQPTWLYRTDGGVSPQMRMAWTVDDLLFYGSSLWQVTRGTDGKILDAERLPWEWWDVTPAGAILVQGKPVPARDVIYFPSHTDPLLTSAATAIRTARSVDESVARRAASPVPVMEIHETGNGDMPITMDEAKELVKTYNTARRDPEGATVFTPAAYELKPHGANADSGALVEGRNASRLDAANHTGVPASMLEGSSAGASLTYVTTEGKRSEFLEYGVTPWLTTVEARLSMDDVVPRGTRVAFDLAALYTPNPSATGAERQD